MLPDIRVRQRDYLLEIARALTQELDLDKLLGRILKISIDLLAGQAGLMALRADTGRWEVKASDGLPPAFLHFAVSVLADIKIDSTLPEDQQLPQITRILQEVAYTASLGLLTGVGLPLIARQKIIGVIFIFRSYQGIFSNNDRALLSSFADQAAIAVQNAQLYTQISQQKQRMDALLDSAADGILILNADFSIERCNQSMARMLGVTPQQFQNHRHDDVIRLANLTQGMTLEQAAAGGWPLTPSAQLYVEGDLMLFNSSAPPASLLAQAAAPTPAAAQTRQNHSSANASRPATLPVGITYAPLIAPDGTLLNIIVTIRDITRFRQADELKSTFISVVSHELKTPIALIKGYVSTLRREDASWDHAIIADSLEVIEEEADHLTGLIENLLDASRLQAGALALKRSDVSLPDLARRTAERFKTQTNRHTILVDFPPAFPIVLADEIRIQQVLSNLISNAIKYAPQGTIQIRGQMRADSAVVCVSDQGPGIAQDDIPLIFDRFYRAPEAARQTKGAGLGLYLSRAIIEGHGGRIWVDADAENGARICFSLPIHN